MIKVVAIATCFNRRQLTVRAVREIQQQFSALTDVSVRFVIVDDGSSDGSAQALRSLDDVHVIEGGGDLYWGGGMALAAANTGEADFILWFNDDVELHQDAIARMLAHSASEPGMIVVGALSDPNTGSQSYGGYRVNREAFRFRLQPVSSESGPREIDSFNGNLVLFPAEVHSRLGGPDPGFTHHYGDFDMGMRARSDGVRLQVLGGFVGSTPRNSNSGTFRDRSLSRRRRISHLFGPKGFPLAERKLYLRRHAGWTWSVQWLGFYAVWALRIALQR